MAGRLEERPQEDVIPYIGLAHLLGFRLLGTCTRGDDVLFVLQRS